MSDTADAILREFDARRELYQQFTDMLKSLLPQLLRSAGVPKPHLIDGRVKDRLSLARKIDGKGYTRLDDITDLCGIRIITYLPEEVDAVAGIIRNHFEIDEANSTDKRAGHAPNAFGYLSLHHVVSLPPVRLQLAENKSFEDLCAEVQIRSIIQHAWAEIEHDLGYKSETAVPPPVRRRFFRLAALLELADDEFTRIKQDIADYARAVASDIEIAPARVPIDTTTLPVFIKSDPALARGDAALAALCGDALLVENPDATPGRIAELRALGLETIDDLRAALDRHHDDALRFAELWLGDTRRDEIPTGTFLLYLCYHLAAASGDAAETAATLKRMNATADPDRVLATYKSATRNG